MNRQFNFQVHTQQKLYMMYTFQSKTIHKNICDSNIYSSLKLEKIQMSITVTRKYILVVYKMNSAQQINKQTGAKCYHVKNA